nr:JAB domain-containing protein [Acetobacter persici]
MVSRLPKSKGRQSRSELADIAGFRLQAETVPERPPLPDLPFFPGLADARVSAGLPDDHTVLTQLITLTAPKHPSADMWRRLCCVSSGLWRRSCPRRIRRCWRRWGRPRALRVTLRLVQEAAVRLHKARLSRAGVLADRAQLRAYLSAVLAHERVEQVRVLFLDAAHRLLADEMLGRGTVDHTPIYPREVMRRALELEARLLVLVHNHPTIPSSITLDHAQAH